MFDFDNPFDSDLALSNSCYAGFVDGRLVALDDPDKELPEIVHFVHGQFRGLVKEPRFVCAGAKTAFNSGTYRFGFYPAMHSPEATSGLSRDLYTFVHERRQLNSQFTTFIACFTGPHPRDEKHFEDLLWQQLQDLHNQDCQYHRWDSTAESDPKHPDFAFSFAEYAFFIVGMHAGSPRWTRRFAWPTMVFNSREQFEELDKVGKFEKIQRTNRAHDTALQGGPNPNVVKYESTLIARQFSGRVVEDNWACPFKAKSENK